MKVLKVLDVLNNKAFEALDKVLGLLEALSDFLDKVGAEWDFITCYYTDVLNEEKSAKKLAKMTSRKRP